MESLPVTEPGDRGDDREAAALRLGFIAGLRGGREGVHARPFGESSNLRSRDPAVSRLTRCPEKENKTKR